MTGSPMPSQAPVGSPPAPASVDASKLTIIDEWRETQVPQYPDAQRLEFQAEAMSQVKNAGRMLFDTTDSPEQVIAFYRSALPLLGWEETSATEKGMAAKNADAAVAISVIPGEAGTRILMEVLDAAF